MPLDGVDEGCALLQLYFPKTLVIACCTLLWHCYEGERIAQLKKVSVKKVVEFAVGGMSKS